MPKKKAPARHKETPVVLIAAIQQDRGIGFQGGLLYQITEDMKHFKDRTLGHTVIMGRKTWESLPEKFRPLPNRTNIVVSRDLNYDAPGAQVVNRFFKALEVAPKEQKIFVIGGGEMYRQALSYADTLELTIIDGNKQADTFFPDFLPYFQEESSSKRYTDDASKVSYRFVSYTKK